VKKILRGVRAKALGINIVRITVDALKLACIIIILATMRPPHLTTHAVVGFIFAGLMILHSILCRKWIIGITKNFKKAKPAVKRQYIINIALTIMWLASVFTGALILMNVGVSEARLDMTRVHGITSVIALVLTVVHIFQHRKGIVRLLKRRKHKAVAKPIEAKGTSTPPSNAISQPANNTPVVQVKEAENIMPLQDNIPVQAVASSSAVKAKTADEICKTRIKILKKINIAVDVLVVGMLIVKLSTIRDFPSLYTYSGITLAILATASMVLHIIVFRMKKQTMTKGDKIMFFEQGLGTVLKAVCIVLGIFVSIYFPQRYEMAGQSGSLMQELNPEFWGLFRAYIVIGIIACVLSALHISKAVVKYYKMKKCEKACC